MKNFVYLTLMIFLIGCGPTSSNEIEPNIITPKDTDKCDSVCTKLRMLGCEEGDDLEDGTSCSKFCHETQNNGYALNLTCIDSGVVQKCEDLSECGAR